MKLWIWMTMGLAVMTCALAAQDKTKADAAKGLRAGAATNNITPEIGGPTVGGFAPFPSMHIHDELLAEHDQGPNTGGKGAGAPAVAAPARAGRSGAVNVSS